MTAFHWRYALLSLLVSELSTSTTTKRITLKSTALPWVRILPFQLTQLSRYILIPSPVLHPRHKLRYFRQAGWEDEWISAAEEIVRAEYDRTYAFSDVGITEADISVCFPLTILLINAITDLHLM